MKYLLLSFLLTISIFSYSQIRNLELPQDTNIV